ncbi:MntP/YtaF family protein [Flavobacterium hauense]
MFKNIQKNLLLNHPLIWNVKFVPLLAITLVINLVFFVYGYLYGKINFTSLAEDNYRIVSSFTAFFGVMIAILTFVLWLVFYFRNNAFKSFYPKTKNKLYKEWLLILVICILNCNYYHSFEYAYKLRARHYFSKEEALKRMDIISRAALFIEGSYRPVDQYETDKTLTEKDNYNNEYDDYAVESAAMVTENDTVQKDSVCYYGILYYHTSFMNKNTGKFTLQQYSQDSINEFKVKRWLYDQKKDSIKKVMDDFLVLAKEHGLKANISSEKWMDIIYHPKQYITHLEVGRDSLRSIGEEMYYQGIHDTVNNYSKRIRGDYVTVPKYHVPYTQLDLSYTRMSEAWFNQYDIENIFIILYFAFSLSLLIFSFRVTSGKSWLIAAVSLAISGLITIIFTMIARHGLGIQISEEVLFPAIWLVIIILLGIWFIRIFRKKQSKKLSYILVNLLLWLLPTIVPILWIEVYSYVSYGYRKYDYEYFVANDPCYPVYEWMNSNFIILFAATLAIVVLYMYFFTKALRKWKGIPEA